MSGGLSITSTAGNANLSIAVTGTGVAPGALALNPRQRQLRQRNGWQQSEPAGRHHKFRRKFRDHQLVPRLRVQDFSISGLVTPLTLSAGQKLPVSRLRFAPQAAGSANGSVAFTEQHRDRQPGDLRERGRPWERWAQILPALLLEASSWGTNQAQTITLTNSGSSSVTISQVIGEAELASA